MEKQETITLKNAVDAYLESLEKNGTKESTVKVYQRALGLALTHFGEEKKLTGIMVPHAVKFFSAQAVNFHPNGKPKAKLTITQTKRVFRQCMEFTKERGWVNILPVPKTELQHARSKKQMSYQRKDTAGTSEAEVVKKARNPNHEEKVDSL